MSSADSGQATSGRIEALLQRVLEGVQQLESKVAAQSGQIQGLQNGLEGVQSKMDVVQADLDGVKGKLLVLDKLDKLDTAQSEMKTEMKDVVRFSKEERARRDKQEWQQIKFVSAIYVAASIGFDKDVLPCFSLNRSTWNDVRLWRVVMNRKYKHTETRLKRLVPKEDLRPDDEDEYVEYNYDETRLIRACRVGRESSVYRLLRLRANIHITDDMGTKALAMASWKGRPNLVKALLAEGAEVDHTDDKGWTALSLSAQNGHIDCVRALINAKADLDHTDNDGYTALSLSAQEGHIECVRALIDAKADVDHAGNNGSTALILAAQNGHIECVRALIDADAEVLHVANSGATALSRATKNKHTEIVAILNEQIAKLKGAAVAGKGKGKHGRGG